MTMVKLVCQECGRKFKANVDRLPECPKCGGTDVEVA